MKNKGQRSLLSKSVSLPAKRSNPTIERLLRPSTGSGLRPEQAKRVEGLRRSAPRNDTLQSRFGKIGVLMGGPSSEREVSLKSGKAVYEVLKRLGYDVAAIDIKTDRVIEDIRLIKSHKINCAFLALHGRFGEDGQIQEILDALEIPYTGSGCLSSKLAMDKVSSRRIFQIHGLSVPRYSVLDKRSYGVHWHISRGFKFPLVVKPAGGGSSIGLSIVDDNAHLKRGINLAFGFDDKIIIEEYIRGREMTVGMLDKQALPVIEIIPKKSFFDFEAKYHPGMAEYIVPAQIKKDVAAGIKKAALFAHNLLHCYGCSRVDLILDKKGIPFVLEINSIPGLTETSLLPKAAGAAGIDFAGLCIKLIELAFQKRKRNSTHEKQWGKITG